VHTATPSHSGPCDTRNANFLHALAMGFPPNAVLLEPNTRSRHGLEWSRSDARRSDPTEWAGPVNIKACEYAEPNEVVGNVSRRYAARHVPVCLSARGSRDRQGSARAVKPLRLQDVHAMALKTLQEMEHTKKLTRIADAWPDELALPTATAERAKKRLLMTFSPPEPASQTSDRFAWVVRWGVLPSFCTCQTRRRSAGSPSRTARATICKSTPTTCST